MDDLFNLKLAIQSNNREQVENVFEKYKQDLSTFSQVQPFSSEQYESLDVDLLASLLIPFDLPLPLHEVSTVKTLGNGNCLFNSVSFLLCHSYRLSTTLRILTGAELFINANKYAHHPKLKFAHDCPEITYDRKNLFAILLREKASMVSDHVQAVQTEAAVTCNDRQWSGMFDIMALSSVLKKNIWAAYPDCNHNIRPIISGVVEQLSCTISQSDLENTLFILWSRDGDLDSTRGHPFEPNHFVPIICKPANQDDLHTNYEEPPFKKIKVNEASVSHQEIYSDGNNNLIDNADFGVGNYQKHEDRNSLTIFQKNEEGHQTSKQQVKPPETRTSTLQSDIGEIITPQMNTAEIKREIDRLSDEQKYQLLKYHYRPPKNFVFPTTFMNGCNRCFKYKWLEQYTPWFVYSCALDGGFCIACALFAKDRESKGILVNKPFNKWTKMSEVMKGSKSSKSGHFKKDSHTKAAAEANGFLQRFENPNQTLPYKLNSEKAKRVAENRTILSSIIEEIQYCARQCIALRGDKEDLSTSGNPGNFLAILKLMSQKDDLLKQHLDHPKQQNATYLSPSNQNELIDVMGNVIRSKIISEIQEAKFFSIMADEVESYNKEKMSLCVRFVDSNSDIREEFIDFVSLLRINGEHIANAIMQTLKKFNLNIQDLRGQGYDGAASMSSERVGVQARIRRESPLAVYTHCSSHKLNLVISHACGLTCVRNMMDKLKETCLFFRSSPLRDALLINIIEVNVPDVGKRKPLLDLCKTRWSARHEAYQHFYQSYCYIIKCLEVMSFGLHKDEGYNVELTNCWNRDNTVRATALLNALTQYEFIITFLTVYKVLSRLEGVTVKLQKKMQDIFDALDVIEEVKLVYQEMRKNVEEYFKGVFLHSERMAEAVGQTPQMPRIVGRQIHKSNVKAATPEEYYLKNLAIPFLDNVNMEIDTQFSVLSTKCMKLFALVPSILCQKNMKVSDLQEVVDLYENDLPSPELIDEEFFAWKLKSQQMQVEERPSTCRNAIKLCAKEHFPNIYVLLKIACTLPITSCECERSFSVMRRLNNYMRASMNHDRLSSLALLHIHYDTELSTAEVIEKFACLHPRRLELKNIIYN